MHTKGAAPCCNGALYKPLYEQWQHNALGQNEPLHSEADMTADGLAHSSENEGPTHLYDQHCPVLYGHNVHKRSGHFMKHC